MLKRSLLYELVTGVTKIFAMATVPNSGMFMDQVGGFWFHVVLILYAADEEQVDESTLSLSRVSS